MNGKFAIQTHLRLLYSKVRVCECFSSSDTAVWVKLEHLIKQVEELGRSEGEYVLQGLLLLNREL